MKKSRFTQQQIAHIIREYRWTNHFANISEKKIVGLKVIELFHRNGETVICT